jgi:aminopeptidase-like protein
VPERFMVHEAYLETEDGEKGGRFKKQQPAFAFLLHASDKVLTWEELEHNLYANKERRLPSLEV